MPSSGSATSVLFASASTHGSALRFSSGASSSRMYGVSTIQQPPGAGTPVKKCFQYGIGACSSIVLKRARRKQSHIA